MSLHLVGGDGEGTVVVGLVGGGRGEARAVGDLAVKATVVEPVDVPEGGELDVGQALPGTAWVDRLPL